MTKKSTKRALVLSIVSIFMTVAMLAGTTLAWFTDSVTSAGNIIKTGTLDVTFEYAVEDSFADAVIADSEWLDASEGSIFTYTNWEPGYVSVKYVKIENVGTLDFKFTLSIIPSEMDVLELAEVIEVYMLSGTVAVDRMALTTDADAYVGTLAQLIDETDGAAHGVLYADDADKAGNVLETYTLALKMSDDAGNEYQNKTVGGSFALQLLATQLTSESDDLGNDYDEDATYPEVEIGNTTKREDAATSVATPDESVQIDIPAEAPAGEYSLEVSEQKTSTDKEGNTTVSMDITLKKDGVKVTADGTTVYTVSVDIGKNLNVAEVNHNGTVITDYRYDKTTGIITFDTADFSPFSFTHYEGGISVTLPEDATEEEKAEAIESLSALIAKGGEFTLTEDVTLPSTLVIPQGVEVVIDLAGKVFAVENSESTYIISNYGTLTIKDSVGGGNVYARGIYNGYSQDGNNVADAKIIIESGTYNAVGPDGGAAIFNYGIAEINGGTFTAIGSYALNTRDGSTMHVKNATLPNSGIYCTGNLTIDNISLYNKRSGCHGIYAYNASVVINGGDFNSTAYNSVLMAAGETSYTVNGGTFSIETNSYLLDGNSYTITGGTFNGGFRSIKMDISGGNFNNDCGSGFDTTSTGYDIGITGGTFDKAANDLFAKFHLESGYRIVKIEDDKYVVSGAPVVVAWSDGQTVEGFDTLTEAVNAVRGSLDKTIFVCEDITEDITNLRGNIVCGKEGGVTITGTHNDWIYVAYDFNIGEGITLSTPALFMYAGNCVINGDVTVEAYYQRYAGTHLTINAPGSLTVTTEMFYLRYTDGDPNAGIIVNGDNDDSTVELKLAVAYFYQGMISAKDATLVVGTYWQTNDTDGQGSANLILDNSKLNVTVNEHNIKFTGVSNVTLKNGSVINGAAGITWGENTTKNIDETSSIVTAR